MSWKEKSILVHFLTLNRILTDMIHIYRRCIMSVCAFLVGCCNIFFDGCSFCFPRGIQGWVIIGKYFGRFFSWVVVMHPWICVSVACYLDYSLSSDLFPRFVQFFSWMFQIRFINQYFLWACSLFSTTLFGVPSPLPTPQGRRAQQLKTRPACST